MTALVQARLHSLDERIEKEFLNSEGALIACAHRLEWLEKRDVRELLARQESDADREQFALRWLRVYAP